MSLLSLFSFLDKDKLDSKKTVVTSDSNSADSLKDPSEKAKDMTFDPTVSEGNLPTVPAAQGSKKDPLTLRNKLKKVRATFTRVYELNKYNKSLENLVLPALPNIFILITQGDCALIHEHS